MPQPLHVSVVNVRRLELVHALDALLTNARRGLRPLINLKRLRPLLEAPPLTSAEFALAANRVANARRYVESAEYGAARYELRLLRRSLEH